MLKSAEWCTSIAVFSSPIGAMTPFWDLYWRAEGSGWSLDKIRTFFISGNWSHGFFAKSPRIVPKHARNTPELNRAQNIEHVAPLHGSWKKLYLSDICVRHLLNLVSILFFFEIWTFHLGLPFGEQIMAWFVPNLCHGCTSLAKRSAKFLGSSDCAVWHFLFST